MSTTERSANLARKVLDAIAMTSTADALLGPGALAIYPVTGLAEVKPGDDLAGLFMDALTHVATATILRRLA